MRRALRRIRRRLRRWRILQWRRVFPRRWEVHLCEGGADFGSAATYWSRSLANRRARVESKDGERANGRPEDWRVVPVSHHLSVPWR